MELKNLIKKVTPPFLIDLIHPRRQYGFIGNYKTWIEAMANSKGYNDPVILEGVKAAALKIKNGEAAYERDSVLFYQKDYNWPLLASLLWIAEQNNRTLNILDFGGSLGSTYFQHREMLKYLVSFNWNIVEQENFVSYGKKYFEDDQLKFFSSITDCLAVTHPNVFLASSTLQYLEKPYELMAKVVNLGFDYLILDRTPFLPSTDRITVQKVNPHIYDASYPAWLLNENKFLKIVYKGYKIAGAWSANYTKTILRGFVFQKK